MLSATATQRQTANLAHFARAGSGDIAAVRESLRKRCREDLWFLAYYVLGYQDIKTPLHSDMCQTWCRRRNRPFSLWLIPRSHLKTTLWTISGCIQEWLRDPDCRILLVNAVVGNALDILREIKAHFESNEFLRWLFPEYKPDPQDKYSRNRKYKWTEVELEFPCRRRRLKEPNFAVMGVEASLVSQHYDLMIFDDPVNDLNSATPEYRDKVYKWFLNSWQLRHDPNTSRIRVIGTRWHYDDLYARIVKQEMRFRGQHNGKQAQWLIYLRRVVEGGVPIWPERFSLDGLKTLRDSLGSYIYSCQYLNEPVPEDEAVLRFSKVQHISRHELPADLAFYGACDLKAGERRMGDNNALVVAAMCERGNLYIFEMLYDRLSPMDMGEQIVRFNRLYGIRQFAVETVFMQEFIVNAMRRIVKRAAEVSFVEMRRQTARKADRIVSLQAPLERGQLFIVHGCRNADALREEMDQFSMTGSKGHDDLLDCLADIWKIAKPPSGVEWMGPPDGSFEDIFGPLDQTEPALSSSVERFLR